MKTLIVDDEYESLAPMMPKDAGISYCGNGESALKAVQSDEFDLVLMDGNFLIGPRGQMQGPDIVKEIRALSIKQPPIYMFTTDECMQKKGMEMGANGIAPKDARFYELAWKVKWEEILWKELLEEVLE